MRFEARNASVSVAKSNDELDPVNTAKEWLEEMKTDGLKGTGKP